MSCWPTGPESKTLWSIWKVNMEKPTNQTQASLGSTPQPAKKPYQRPLLSNLGSLRELTMTKDSKFGAGDGKNKRFTGRGGHWLAGDRPS